MTPPKFNFPEVVRMLSGDEQLVEEVAWFLELRAEENWLGDLVRHLVLVAHAHGPSCAASDVENIRRIVTDEIDALHRQLEVAQDVVEKYPTLLRRTEAERLCADV